MRTFAGGIALVLLGALVTVPAGAQESGESSGQWIHVGDDQVVWVEDGGGAGDAVAALGYEGQCTGSGYILYDCGRALDTHYTIRLVKSGDSDGDGTDDAEEFRTFVNGAVSNLEANVTGFSASVASGLITVPDKSDLDPGTREVYLVVHGTTPCGPGFAGCGGPRGDSVSDLSGVPYLDGGAAWIYPVALGYTSTQKQHLTSHELGHAFGLRHFDGTFSGATQVMHSSSYDAPNFRAGDHNGFDTQVTNGRVDFIGFGSDFFRASWDGEEYSVGATYQPFTGDFDGDGNDDIFWYRPGTNSDPFWWGDTDRTFSSQSFDVDGTYVPAAGDFDADGRDDVFWHAPGAAQDVIWWGNANRTFTSMNWGLEASSFTPLAGDFNGDGADDIVFYAPGETQDRIWWGTPLVRNIHPIQDTGNVGATYTPWVGNFDGDGEDDIFWYRTTGSEAIWWGDPQVRITGTFTSTSPGDVGATYETAAGDFDADGRTDIVWHRAGSLSDSSWWGRTDRTFDNVSIVHNGDFELFSGDFDGDGASDVFGYRPGT